MKVPQLNEKFNLVSVIAICFCADCAYEDKAKKASRLILKGRFDWPTPPPSAALFKGDDAVDAQWNRWSKETYDDFFQEIVAEETDDSWTWDYDKWGAKTYFDDNKRPLLSGDAIYEFPWYEAAGDLRDRILRIIKE